MQSALGNDDARQGSVTPSKEYLMPAAKAYIVALAISVLVGAIYGLLGVRSPAPPVVALVGLLGMLLGEQIVPIASHLLQRQPAKLSDIGNSCAHQLFGALPGTGLGATADVTPSPRSSPPERLA